MSNRYSWREIALLVLGALAFSFLINLPTIHRIQALQADPAPAPINVLVNGEMIDADSDGLPDGWQGLELGAADRVLCGANRCKFQFDGVPAQRTLFQTIPYVTPPGTRLKFTVDVSFKNVGYGSYLQLFGTRNGSLTTIYHMDIPLGKQKRSMVISGVAGMDGIDHLTALITVTAGSLKASAARLETDP